MDLPRIGTLPLGGAYSSPSASAEKPASDTSAEDAVRGFVDGLSSRTQFKNDLEVHLDSYRKGQAHTYKDYRVSGQLFDMQTRTNTSLGGNTRALQYYQGIVSALDYSGRARFVEGVDQGEENIRRLLNASA